MLSDRTKIGLAIIIVVSLLVFYLGTVSSMSFFVNDSLVGDESTVNFLDGNGTTVTVVHDALNGHMDVTVNATSTPAIAGGPEGAIQFNIGGSVEGDSGLTFATSTDALTVQGPIINPFLDCTGFDNDGAITATSTGEFICSNDDGGAGGPTFFEDINSGTNVTADMIVGTGASIEIEGTGHIHSSLSILLINNDSGSTLFECTAVYSSNFDIPSDLGEVLIADYDNASTMPALGLIHEDTLNGANGHVITSGTMDGLDTDNAESWSVGDLLWVNNTGASADTECGNTLTNIKPTGAVTDLIQVIAIVGRVHPSNGQLTVFANGRVAGLPNITDDNLWVGNGSAVPTLELLPDSDGSTQKLQYDQTTNAFSVGTDLQGYALIDDEGTPLTAQTTLNFTGAGVTCVNDGAGSETDCDIPGGSGGYATIEDEDSALTQFTILNFTGAGVVCTNGASQTDCTIAGGAGGEDLQGTYDVESAPALIVLTDALGGITFNGDAENTEASFTILDDSPSFTDIGIHLDNDDEVSAEDSPLIQFSNSTVAGGDDHFSIGVDSTGLFVITGDDDAIDLQIDSSGNVTLFQQLRLFETGGGSEYISIAAPATLASVRTCVLEDDATPFDTCITPGSGGDLQATYDSETTPALITQTDAIGGIIFDSDSEPTDPALTLRDNQPDIGLLIDNDNEAVFADSPKLRFANSTSGAGDIQFDIYYDWVAEALVFADDDGDFRMQISDNTISDFIVLQTENVSIGLGGLNNPTLTFNTSVAGDGDIQFDDTTDNRFEINQPWVIEGPTNYIGAGDGAAFRAYEPIGAGTNYIEIVAPATIASNRTCVLEDDTTPFDGCITVGGANSFETWDTPAGTDPVADTSTDTIQFLVTGSDLSITGADGPETITFDILANAGTDITADLEEEAHNTEHADGGADVLYTERHITFFISGDVTTGTKQVRFTLRRAVTYKDAHCEVQTQGTTSAIAVNFLEDGTDIFTDGERVSIAAASDGDTSSTPTDTTGAANEVIELIVDTADSGNTGSDLTCELRIRHPVDSSL